jgi:hypothetical protein
MDLPAVVFAPDDRVHFREKVRRCRDVFATLLDGPAFDDDFGMTGLEIELNLADADGRPAMRNAEVLARLADPRFQAELGQFNLELNTAPRTLAGDGFGDYRRHIADSLRLAGDRAAKIGSGIVLIGMLPTLTAGDLVLANLSHNPRYRQLNDELAAARGEQFRLDIHGVERLQRLSDSIAPEAACTSVQFHLQVPRDRFAACWNASQAIAGIQVALGANSPYLLGHRLWAETRIALFEQVTDTRPEELKAQGVRPRVWFGERWITSALDLFDENLRYFPPLLPVLSDEDPEAALRAGDIPGLTELRLHNGTVYRWNRPVYDVMDGLPHLRVENRVLPSGPTVVDLLANAAFYFGLTRELAEDEQPIWDRLPFAAARDNFVAGARDGIDASVCWPGRGQIPVTALVLEELLPKAHAGLDRFGVTPLWRDRLLSIIEGRCRTGVNGAAWQTTVASRLEQDGMMRPAALREMLRRYRELQQSDQPVHSWPY